MGGWPVSISACLSLKACWLCSAFFNVSHSFPARLKEVKLQQ